MACNITILAPDATAVVKDTSGTVLATQNIPSGVSEDIIVNTGGADPLYAYNYGSLNTGQDVSYAVGDDKWVRDNVFNPEIASWPTDRLWIFPVLDPLDPTKLLRGATPEGTNIFGNLERFTDENGGQAFNNYYIDHYLGVAININNTDSNWFDYLQNALDLVFNSKNDWFSANINILKGLSNNKIRSTQEPLSFNPFNNTIDTNYASSTTVYSDTANELYLARNNNIAGNAIKNLVGNFGQIYTRKAFTYDPLTDTTKLILS